MLELAYKALDLLLGALFGARRIRVRVHIAAFVPASEPTVFVKVVNLSRERDVEITHVWLASEPNIPIFNTERPLPVRLRPDETWETWFELRAVPLDFGDSVFNRVRVQLSSGTVFKSKQNTDIPVFGHVAGPHPEEPAKSTQRGTERTLAIVRNIYGVKSGWAPAQPAGRAMVVAPYVVTNISNKRIVVTKVEARFGAHREAAGLSLPKEYIPPDETQSIVAIFFANPPGLKRGQDFVADIVFVDQYGNEHVLAGERFRSVPSLP